MPECSQGSNSLSSCCLIDETSGILEWAYFKDVRRNITCDTLCDEMCSIEPSCCSNTSRLNNGHIIITAKVCGLEDYELQCFAIYVNSTSCSEGKFD